MKPARQQQSEVGANGTSRPRTVAAVTDSDMACTRPIRSASAAHGMTPIARPDRGGGHGERGVGGPDAEIGSDQRQHGLRGVQLGEGRHTGAEQRGQQPSVVGGSSRMPVPGKGRVGASIVTETSV